MTSRLRSPAAAVAVALAVVGAVAATTACEPQLPVPAIVYTYEVRGYDNSSDLGAFAAAAAETYDDPRGWGLGHVIAFRQVASGGDFTLWLAAPARVAEFAPVCDEGWSCSVGRNVVINERNWLNGTAAWNGAGGSLRDYQHLVVDHETGHWLGLGHARCGGAGQAAPVMQQQSIDLAGCVPNPWPLESERQTVAANRSVAINRGDPFGWVDALGAVPGGVRAVGWSIDPDTAEPVEVHVHADDAVGVAPAAGDRPDVAAAYPAYGPAHGFDVVVPAPPGTHHVCVWGVQRAGGGTDAPIGCGDVTVG